MEIDINYANAYIYNLLKELFPAYKYRTVTNKTLFTILNSIKKYVSDQNTEDLIYSFDDSLSKVFNELFYNDEVVLILKEQDSSNKKALNLSLFLLLGMSKKSKEGKMFEYVFFNDVALNYLKQHKDVIEALLEQDKDYVIHTFKQVEEKYKSLQTAHIANLIGNIPVQEIKYELYQSARTRNQLLKRLCADSIIYGEISKISGDSISFLDDDYYMTRLKLDANIYFNSFFNYSSSSKNPNRTDFLYYLTNIVVANYNRNVRDVLDSGVVDAFPEVKKYLEIEFIASSLLSEEEFLNTGEKRLSIEKEKACEDKSEEVIYHLCEDSLDAEISKILSITDSQYTTDVYLLAKSLNRILVMKSIGDISQNISEEINKKMISYPSYYHSSYQVSSSLLSNFTNPTMACNKVMQKIKVA